jgi:hypothetical protein
MILSARAHPAFIAALGMSSTSPGWVAGPSKVHFALVLVKFILLDREKHAGFISLSGKHRTVAILA